MNVIVALGKNFFNQGIRQFNRVAALGGRKAPVHEPGHKNIFKFQTLGRMNGHNPNDVGADFHVNRQITNFTRFYLISYGRHKISDSRVGFGFFPAFNAAMKLIEIAKFIP